MELFGTDAIDGYTIIVGCGRLGSKLPNLLSANGENVLVIDSKKDSFRKLTHAFGGLTLTGDATDITILRDANIETASAVVAVTDNDNTNIMVAQIAKEMFNIEYVIARLYDPDREAVYNEFEINTICPASLSADEIEKLLSESREVEAQK